MSPVGPFAQFVSVSPLKNSLNSCLLTRFHDSSFEGRMEETRPNQLVLHCHASAFNTPHSGDPVTSSSTTTQLPGLACGNNMGE